MKAPTNIYGPDASLCRAGEEIPADWFDALPDLQQHLDNLRSDLAPTVDVAATATVEASMTVSRKRASS